MCSLDKHPGGVYVLTLLGDEEHRLNPTSLAAITDALETVQNSEDARALVTTNEGKFFSNGLDLKWLNVDAKSRASLLGTSFHHLLLTLLRMNIPTIAAICGHAAAGGFLFAMAHDHRCMRKDKGFMLLNELDVGVMFTSGTITLLKSKISPTVLKTAVLSVHKYTATSAYEAGIVDSMHENAAATLEAAVNKAYDLGRRGWSKLEYQTMRLSMYPEVIEAFKKEEVEALMKSKL